MKNIFKIIVWFCPILLIVIGLAFVYRKFSNKD